MTIHHELVAVSPRVLEAEHDRLDPGAVDEIELGEVESHRAAAFAVLTQTLLDGISDRDVELADQGNAEPAVTVDAFLNLKRWPGKCHACRQYLFWNGRGCASAQS